MKSLVDVSGISKTYEPLPRSMRILLRTQVSEPVIALRDVSLEVASGQAVVVVGPNGAGKSTLFRILTGLTTPTAGTARIAGLDVTTQSADVRRLIGFAPADERTLLLRHTCRENLDFRGMMQGLNSQERSRAIDRALEFVGLGDVADRAAVALSSGMKARLQLARALLTDPLVVILDEPTASIDPLSASEIIRLVLQSARERGAAVLISSHRLEEIEELQERTLLLDEGRVVYSGDLGQLRRRFAGETLQIRCVDNDAATRIKQWLKAEGLSVDAADHGAFIEVQNEMSVVELAGLLDNQHGVEGIDRRRASLLEVMKRASGASE